MVKDEFLKRRSFLFIPISVFFLLFSAVSFASSTHTITVNGDLSDWSADEILPTYGPNDFRFTWDNNNFYVGLNRGSAFPIDSNNYDVTAIYFDISNSTGSNVSIDWSGTHKLPFYADWAYVVCSTRIADPEYANLRYWDTGSSSWQPKNGDWNYGSGYWASNKTATYSGDKLEFYIPKSDIGFTSTNTVKILIYEINGTNGWLWGNTPHINETGPAPQTLHAYWDYGVGAVAGISPYEDQYLKTNLSLGPENDTVSAFTPIVDGIKELYWGINPSETSTSADKPNAETDFSTTTPKPAWFDEVTEGLANDIYVTNDAGYLYIGWKARGDPYEKETDNTEQPAHYEFLVFTASSPAGGNYDPWKSASDVRLVNFGAKVWVNGYIGWTETDFTGMTRYKFVHGAWDDGTALTRGDDFKVDLSLTNIWGELRIPLEEIGVGQGEKIGVIYAARHSAEKPGFNDSTPYMPASVSDWGDSSSVIYSTDCYVYRIQKAMITAYHIPTSTPVAGWAQMRAPLNPSSLQSPEMTLDIYPLGLTGDFYLKFSTDNWTSTVSEVLDDERFSGENKFLFASIPVFKRNVTVKYYFDLSSNGMETYVFGGSTYSMRTSDLATAQAGAFSYVVGNSSPTSPTDVSITPSLALSSDNLACSASGSSDPDGDALTYVFNWYKNGVFFSSSTDNLAPYESTILSANTHSGEEWFCKVKTTDTLNASSDYLASQTVLISSYSWKISSFERKNESKVESGEFLFEDKTGETSDPDFDIEEFHLAGNTSDVFVRIKMKSAISADDYQFALTFSTSSGGHSSIGDDSGFSLGNLYGENLWQRQIIFHSTATGCFTAELNDGTGWSQSSASADFYENSAVMEAQIPRSEVGLVSTTTFKISLAVFRNSVGRAQAKDTTSSGALDCLAISSFTLNDNDWQISASSEDLSDEDVDFFSEMKILSTGSIVNQKPASFSLLKPSGTIAQLNPYFDWTDSFDSDGGITSYIIEIATSASMDGKILWRVNTSTSEFQLPQNLTGENTYYWRAGARDATGEITFATTWYFYISVTEPVCSAPQDDTNLNNYGEANGIEDADGNVTFYWPPATDSVAIQNYYIRISTDSSFDFVYSSATTSASVRRYTFTGLGRGLFWYAQVRAKNVSGITGQWSDASDGIYVDRKTVDADLSDWSCPTLSKNTTGLFQNDAFWSDEKGDERTDKSDASQLDISTFALTADRYNLYFYFVFASTVGSFGSGRQLVELAVDNDKTSTERVLLGRNVTSEDTYTSGDMPWEYVLKITSTSGTGSVEAFDSGFNVTGYGKYTENASNCFIEGMMPLDKIGGSSSFLSSDVNFAAAVLENDGTGNVSQWAAGNSNVVDVVSSTDTWSEVSDQVIDFYLTVSFDSNGKVVNIASHTVTNVPPPDEPISGGYSYSWPRNLVVYYLNVDRFYDGDPTNEPSDTNMTGGDFQGIEDKLDYLNSLGVNMIYTMPIDYFGGGVWGFNHSDIYRIQDSYGDFQKFTDMVKKLKRRNIKIAIDWVAGQIYEGRTRQRHPEIFYGERFGAVGGRTCQRMADMMEFFAEDTRFWVGLGVDAFRVDNTKFYPDDISLSHLFFKYWRRKTDEYKPDFWDFGECPDSDYNVGSYVYNGDQLHGMQNFPGKYDLRDWTNNDNSATFTSNVDAHDAAYGDKPVMQTFANNHDEDRIYHYIGDDVNVSPWRLQPILIYMFTDRDPPCLMYGNEKCMMGKKNYTYPSWEYTDDTSLFGNTRAMPWDNDGTAAPDTITALVKKLGEARDIFPSLRSNDRSWGSETADGGLLVMKRTSSNWPYEIIVVINPTDSTINDVNLSATAGTTNNYKDWLTDTEYTSDGDGTFTPKLDVGSNYGAILVKQDGSTFYSTGTVKGTVSGLNPGTKAIVSIDAPDGVSCSAWTVETDKNGNYEIKRVIAGTRYIRWWAPGKKYEGATFTVNATGETTQDISLVDDSVAPATPTGFSAEGKDAGIDLGWNKNTESDFESYIIQYALSPTGPWNWAAECLDNAFYFNGYDPNNKYYDTGLTNGTTYYFRICAQDRNENKSPWSDVVSAVPHKTSTKFWVDVRQTSYYPDNITKVQIAGNSQALGYAQDAWNPMDMTNNGNGSYEITLQHSPGMIVQYKYIIVDNQGNSVWENDFGASPDNNNREITISDGDSTQIVANIFNQAGDVAPASPEDLTVATSSETVYLGWKRNIEPDLAGYYIERSTYSSTQGFDFLSNAASNVVAFTDSGLKNGNTYYYRMKAYDAQNNYSDFSPVMSGCPNPGDTTPPSAPTNLTAYGAGPSGVKIYWFRATEADTAGYNVYRGTFPSFVIGPSNKLNSALVSKSLSPSYTDLTITIGSTFYYKITAVDDSSNESVASSALSVFLTRVSFSVDAGAERQSVSVFGYPEPLSSSGFALEKKTTYTWTGNLVFPAGTKIYYKYRYDGETDEGDFDTTSRYRELSVGFENVTRGDDWEEIPARVENLSAYPLSGGAWLDWSANTSAEDLAGYKIYYSTDANNFNFKRNEIVTDSQATLTGLTNGTSYYVIVRAVDGGDIKLESENAFTSFVLPKEPVFVKFIVASGASGFDSLEKYISIQSGLDTSAWLDRGNIAQQSSSLVQPLIPGATYNYLLFVKTGAFPPDGLSSYNWYYDCVPASGKKIPTSTSSSTITGYTAEYLSVSPAYDARRVLWVPDTLSAHSTYYVFNNFASTPSAPSSIQAIPDGKDAVILSWQPPYGFWGSGGEEFKAVDVVEGGKYLIYRSTFSPSAGFSQIASVNGSSFTYRDTGLIENNTYYYILVSSDCYSGKNMIENRYSVFSSTAYACTRGKIPIYFRVDRRKGGDKKGFRENFPAVLRRKWFAFTRVFLPGENRIRR